jgi:hypothetical protein
MESLCERSGPRYFASWPRALRRFFMIRRAASICFSGTPGCELALDARLEGGDNEVSFDAASSRVCFCCVIRTPFEPISAPSTDYATDRHDALIGLYEAVRVPRGQLDAQPRQKAFIQRPLSAILEN